MRVALSTLSSLEFNLIYCYCHFVNQIKPEKSDGMGRWKLEKESKRIV